MNLAAKFPNHFLDPNSESHKTKKVNICYIYVTVRMLKQIFRSDPMKPERSVSLSAVYNHENLLDT